MVGNENRTEMFAGSHQSVKNRIYFIRKQQSSRVEKEKFVKLKREKDREGNRHRSKSNALIYHEKAGGRREYCQLNLNNVRKTENIFIIYGETNVKQNKNYINVKMMKKKNRKKGSTTKEIIFIILKETNTYTYTRTQKYTRIHAD